MGQYCGNEVIARPPFIPVMCARSAWNSPRYLLDTSAITSDTCEIRAIYVRNMSALVRDMSVPVEAQEGEFFRVSVIRPRLCVIRT